MSNPPSPDSSSLPGATPPPLPKKALLFKLAWRLGFWFGIMQISFLLLAFVLYFVSPGGPPPLILFLGGAAAGLQTFAARFISRNPTGGRTLFAMATIFASLCYLPTPFFILGVFNVGPVLLLMASSSPDVTSTTAADNSLAPEARLLSEQPAPPNEDLY